MKYIYYLFIYLFTLSAFSQDEAVLKHNIGDNIIDQIYNFTCSGGGVNWARQFVLEDFDITNDFTIKSVTFAVQETSAAPGDGAVINIYIIDENFPDSFNENGLVAQSENIPIPSYTHHQFFTYEFQDPIVIPSSTERILVEVYQEFSNMNMFIGGTMDSFDFSWFRSNHASCVGEQGKYQSTFDLNRPDLNYYISVTGDHLLGSTELNQNTFSIYPNPVSNQLNFKASQNLSNFEVKVVDISGKEMMETAIIDNILDVSSLTSGIYFISISSNSGFTKIQKIIKQ